MTQPQHPNVIQALAAIQADFRNPEKLSPDERKKRGMGGGDTGVTYAYRGIDQIEAEVQRLCGAHGVVIAPAAVLDVEVVDIQINNRPWSDSRIRVRWSVMGPGGVDDAFIAESIGWGRDNADKGYNKAFTSARKNLLLALFHIGDPNDDSDGHTPERDSIADTPPPGRAEAIALFEHIRDSSPPVKQAVKDFAELHGRKVTIDSMMDSEWRGMVYELVSRAEVAAGLAAAEEVIEQASGVSDVVRGPAPTQEALLPGETPADTTGPFPADNRQRLSDWMRADAANVTRFHSVCQSLGLARAGQRRVVKSLTDDEADRIVDHLFSPSDQF